MGAWLKLFEDGTKEYGSDEKIVKNQASWSQGRLSDIKEVKLFNLRQEASLSVSKTSWHQFDRYQVGIVFGTQKSKITHRVVQAEIKQHHLGSYLVCFKSVGNIECAIVQDFKEAKKGYFDKLIMGYHIGKWITIILPEEDYPAITFSTKGKMNDSQRIPKQRN